jgi:7,8-dihydropterin-6-yl-methyl-4-(beta-D-ribofuranosyl)aminobenzene 5'-phosphate synthase
VYVTLPEIDRLSITLLVDNYTDRLLPSSLIAIRPPMTKNGQFLPPPPPVAEHGFSALIRVAYNDNGKYLNKGGSVSENVILFDCGTSENGVLSNAEILGISFNSINAIILSHGHFDHFTGLPSILKKIDKPIRLICHPDAFLRRWIVFPNGKDKARLPFLDKEELEKQGAIIMTKKEPSLISQNNIEEYKYQSNDNAVDKSIPKLLVTGWIPRTTTYEKGFPLQYKEDLDSSSLIPDPLVNDDQAIVANVKNKGLIIISGCAHAGIINTIRYAKMLTGINKIYAVIGGFHLTGGGIYEDAIEPTITELKKIGPRYLIPCHCTGWKATNRIIHELPDKFLQPSTCTTFNFAFDSAY